MAKLKNIEISLEGNVRENVLLALAPFRKYKSPSGQIQAEAQGHYRIDKIEISRYGRKIYKVGMEYPEDGFAIDTDLHAINTAKRLLMEGVRLMPLLSPLIPIFLVLPFKYKIKIVDKILTFYNSVSLKAMSHTIFEKNMLTRRGKAIREFTHNFLLELGVSQRNAEEFSDIFSTCIDEDQAYGYRISDILPLTTKEKLIAKPIKEIKRLLNEYKKREIVHSQVVGKFQSIANILLVTLYHPKVKKAFISSFNKVKYSQFTPNKHDRFWMCLRKGYNFFGKNDKERWAMVAHLKVVKPNK